jgi:hypothetical protein
VGEPPPSSLEEGDSASAAAVHVATTTTGHQHLLSDNTFLVNRVMFKTQKCKVASIKKINLMFLQASTVPVPHIKYHSVIKIRISNCFGPPQSGSESILGMRIRISGARKLTKIKKET